MYKFNSSKKNQILAMWVLSHTKYKIALIFLVLSVGLGIALFMVSRGWILNLLINNVAPFRNNKNIAIPISTLASIILGLIPVFIFYRIQARVLVGIEEPYHSMVDERIMLTDNGFEYSYHYTHNPNPTARECYIILYKDIEEVVYRKKYSIMTIYGKGAIKVVQNKRGYLNVVETSDICTNTETFSIFVAVNDINEFLRNFSNYTTINFTNK